MLPEKLPAPLYEAVNEWLPAGSVADIIAFPLTRLAVPSVFDPSLNVTEPPVGMVELGGSVVTVAVRTSEVPYVSVLAEAESEIKVAVESSCLSSRAVTIKRTPRSWRLFARARPSRRRGFVPNHVGADSSDNIRILPG